MYNFILALLITHIFFFSENVEVINNTFEDIAKISVNPVGNNFSEISIKTKIKSNTTCGVILQWHYTCTTHPH
jgi:hypothetical protein